MANNKKTPSKAIGRFFKGIGGFFAEFGTAVSKGDIFTKLHRSRKFRSGIPALDTMRFLSLIHI